MYPPSKALMRDTALRQRWEDEDTEIHFEEFSREGVIQCFSPIGGPLARLFSTTHSQHWLLGTVTS
jgi:hypothetical protein